MSPHLPPREYEPIDRRTVFIAGCAMALGVAGGVVARLLTWLIGIVTGLAYFGTAAATSSSPALSHRPALVMVLIPLIGALVVGVMARYGAPGIRGHGIPEVMERVLFAESRISLRMLVLKPLSTAIVIGTGGPFGSEGPIIATGGALGSLVGQYLHVTSDERKTLLASGAAAGMAATFGSPVSAVLIAIELLLFEYRARSLIPVALAAAVAAAMRIAFEGSAPIFAISGLTQPSGAALAAYGALGLVIGAVAAGITRVSYRIEDLFEMAGERLHIHWMWWPLAGALVVGVVGLIEPRTLGVGYSNIVGALDGTIAGRALLALVVLKFISWSIYLGSGTSGGTLAPLFTIGGGLGAYIGAHVARLAPALAIDARIAGLVGMAAMFAGASHALLTAVVFAFETTRQPVGLLPLLAGCTAAYLVSLLLGRHSIMTEKLARRGTPIRPEYAADHLGHTLVRDAASADVVTLAGSALLGTVRAWIATDAGDITHQGFPVLDDAGQLCGVVTRRDLADVAHQDGARVREVIRRAPVVVYDDSTLRDAADQMVLADVGRLPVVRRAAPTELIGFITRSDIVGAHAGRLESAHRRHRVRLLFGNPED